MHCKNGVVNTAEARQPLPHADLREVRPRGLVAAAALEREPFIFAFAPAVLPFDPTALPAKTTFKYLVFSVSPPAWNGLPITAYDVRWIRKPECGNNVFDEADTTTLITPTPNAHTYQAVQELTLPDLAAGTTFVLQVAARNSAGASPTWSNPVEMTTTVPVTAAASATPGSATLTTAAICLTLAASVERFHKLNAAARVHATNFHLIVDNMQREEAIVQSNILPNLSEEAFVLRVLVEENVRSARARRKARVRVCM